MRLEVKRKREAIKVAQRLRDSAVSEGVRLYWDPVIKAIRQSIKRLTIHDED